MISDTLKPLLDSCTGSTPHFPPTLLYNEGWMLRLVLHWFSMNPVIGHPLIFPSDGFWFSEALLPSPFLPRHRGDPLSESRTHADGVIGQVIIGKQGKADLEIRPDGNHFVICEAKLYSRLSKDVKHAPFYDQASRNVACMAEVTRRQRASASQFCQLGFNVLAPKAQIDAGVFTRELEKSNILEMVTERAQQYNGERDEWLRECFEPFLQKVVVRAVAWEDVLSVIFGCDRGYGSALIDFYEQCLRYNKA